MLSTIFDVKWHYFIAVSVMKRYCEMCVCVYFAMSPLEISTEQPILLNIHLNCQHKTLLPANEKKNKKIKWEKKTNKRKRLEIWYFFRFSYFSFSSVFSFCFRFLVSFFPFYFCLFSRHFRSQSEWIEVKWNEVAKQIYYVFIVFRHRHQHHHQIQHKYRMTEYLLMLWLYF